MELLGLPSYLNPELISGTILTGVASGLLAGLIAGLALGLVLGGKNEDPNNSLIINTRDNFNFSWKTFLFYLKNRLFEGLAFGLVFGLIGTLLTGSSVGLLAGLSVGLLAGLIAGVFDMTDKNTSHFVQINHPHQRFKNSAKIFYFSIFQHWHLFHLFNKYGLLPRKIVPFLDEMTKLYILESDGASWRFRHRILQDYFAEQWVEPDHL